MDAMINNVKTNLAGRLGGQEHTQSFCRPLRRTGTSQTLQKKTNTQEERRQATCGQKPDETKTRFNHRQPDLTQRTNIIVFQGKHPGVSWATLYYAQELVHHPWGRRKPIGVGVIRGMGHRTQAHHSLYEEAVVLRRHIVQTE